jgi:hypothetical protein
MYVYSIIMNKVRGTGIENPRNITSIVEKDEREKLEEIGWREHLSISEINRKAVQEYIKNHGDGNETFKLDQFQDPNFVAMPAFMSPTGKWTEFVVKHADREERAKIYKQADYIRMMARSQNHLEEMKNHEECRCEK